MLTTTQVNIGYRVAPDAVPFESDPSGNSLKYRCLECCRFDTCYLRKIWLLPMVGDAQRLRKAEPINQPCKSISSVWLAKIGTRCGRYSNTPSQGMRTLWKSGRSDQTCRFKSGTRSLRIQRDEVQVPFSY